MPDDVITKICDYCKRCFNLEYVGFVTKEKKHCCGDEDCCKQHKELEDGEKPREESGPR